jgi:hypothetical protein
MRRWANIGRTAVIVAVALPIVMWTAGSSTFAAQPGPAPHAQQTAPIGHRQPNASDVPASVLRDENAMQAEDSKLDKELNICRGC